jgi:hypothetical protein
VDGGGRKPDDYAVGWRRLQGGTRRRPTFLKSDSGVKTNSVSAVSLGIGWAVVPTGPRTDRRGLAYRPMCGGWVCIDFPVLADLYVESRRLKNSKIPTPCRVVSLIFSK